MLRLALLAAILTGALVVAGTLPPSDPQPVQAATTLPFTFTGGPVNYTVPAGVTRILITANGASGGSTPCNSAGGAGGLVSAVVTVTPGSTLQILGGGIG